MIPVSLSNEEKRLLQLSMSILSYQDLILSDIYSEDLVQAMKNDVEKYKHEYDVLFDKVDQPTLIKKLT